MPRTLHRSPNSLVSLVKQSPPLRPYPSADTAVSAPFPATLGRVSVLTAFSPLTSQPFQVAPSPVNPLRSPCMPYYSIPGTGPGHLLFSQPHLTWCNYPPPNLCP